MCIIYGKGFHSSLTLVFIYSPYFHFLLSEMSSSSFSNGSSSSSDDLISSSSDENILGDMGQNDLIIFQMIATMTSNSNDLFLSNEIEEGGMGQYVDPTMGVSHVLGIIRATLALLKALTNFTLEEFDKLASQMGPTIGTHAKSIGELCIFFIFLFFYLKFKV